MEPGVRGTLPGSHILPWECVDCDPGKRRNRLLLPGRRIVINIVAAAVTQENTALRLKLANKLATLHSAISFVL